MSSPLQPSVSLRSYLTALTLATLFPLAVFAIGVGAMLIRQERESFLDYAEERALALLVALDTELKGSIDTMRALSAVPSLTEGNLEEFRKVAAEVLASHPDWLNVNIALPSGQQIANLRAPPDRPLPNNRDQGDSFDRALQTGKPTVSGLIFGPILQKWDFAVRVPVIRDGTVKYVLSAIENPDAVDRVISAQSWPPGWVAMVVDRDNRTIARSLEPQKSRGQLAAQGLHEALARSPSGTFRGETREGTAVHTFYRRSAESGWTVAIHIPASAVNAATARAIWLLAAGLLLAVILGIVLARIISRRVAAPIGSLAAATGAVARGAAVEIGGETRIEELRQLAAAMRTAAEAVAERQALIEREKQALESADRAKDEFLAMLSHELRNPLAALTAAAHVLKLAPPGDAAGIKARAVVDRQTKHMARLVGDLLDISRVSMGRVSLERERINLADAVANVVSAWQASGRFERHRASLEAKPAWVDADRARIEQIISNLLDNAVKFTPTGKLIRVGVAQEGNWAVLRVADEGEGLDPGQAERMFELFVQGERGLDRASGGLGVGLALVKRLTELHDGTVSATSAGHGRGATFTVRLPSVPPPAAPAAAPDLALRVEPRRVLIVEDNDDMRQMLHETLTFSGHEVREARDGASGLALAAESQPDVALIDVGLPDVDGYEVARRLRAAAGGRRIGLIAITGYGQAEDQRRAYEAGFDAHLTKPVAPERLKQVMAGLQ